jgi:uncharacterized protein (DUF433 family)
VAFDDDFIAEFWSRVDHRGACGIWTGGTRSGYPIFKGKLATRIAFALTYGDDAIPPGRHVRRRCASRLCISPDHLTVDPDVHVRRPTYVMTRMQADDVRVRHAAGVSIAELANLYGISKQHVNNIVNGAVWSGDGTRRPKPGSVMIVRVEADADGVMQDVLACGHRVDSTPWPNAWRRCWECSP